MTVFFFFFNDTATTETYTYGHTRSLHDALPISATPAIARAQRVSDDSRAVGHGLTALHSGGPGGRTVRRRRHGRRAAGNRAASGRHSGDRKSTRLNSSH